MLRILLASIVAFSFTIGVAQAGDQAKQLKAPIAALVQVRINGKRLSASEVVVRSGDAFVSVQALGKYLSIPADRHGNVIALNADQQTANCGPNQDPRLALSDAFRKRAAPISYDIERLRIVMPQVSTADFSRKSDAIDAELSRARISITTTGDQAVYYALAHGNNTLGVDYYRSKLPQAGPPDDGTQSDSLICAMDSHFAVLTGHLSGMESCSVIKRVLAGAEPEKEP